MGEYFRLRLPNGELFTFLQGFVETTPGAAAERVPVYPALFRTPQGAFLLDAGVGQRQFAVQGIPVSCQAVLPLTVLLAEVGVSPEEVRGVFLSHLHCDHVEGLLEGGRLPFRRATILVHEKEVQFLRRGSAPYPYALPPLLALQEQAREIRTWRGRTSAPLPGFRLEWTGGHTPGHVLAVLEAGSRGRVWFTGDLVVRSFCLQAGRNLKVHHDVQQVESVKERLRKAYEEGEILHLYHEPRAPFVVAPAGREVIERVPADFTLQLAWRARDGRRKE